MLSIFAVTSADKNPGTVKMQTPPEMQAGAMNAESAAVEHERSREEMGTQP